MSSPTASDLPQSTTIRSYLRWVGGKRRLVSRLRRYVPRDYGAGTYHEPFLGAGSLFLELQPRRAYLSDLNESLIRSFECVRARPGLVARYLTGHAARNSSDYYYDTRDRYNRARTFSSAQAARFIYLNRTCYNGVFRVNQQGRFNVPYGQLARPVFPNRDNLKRVSQAFQGVRLRVLGYQEALEDVSEGDFVYLDPPYPPLNGTSLFRHYTPQRFSFSDHKDLARAAMRLKDRGCRVMISNADLPTIRELYDGLYMTELKVTRSVTCKKIKHSVSELLITSYSKADMVGDGSPSAAGHSG